MTVQELIALLQEYAKHFGDRPISIAHDGSVADLIIEADNIGTWIYVLCDNLECR